MLLYLLRHGIAIDRGDPQCPRDPDRELTERGAARTRAAVRGLRRLGVAPDLIVTSPYVRARETADIAAGVLDCAAPVRVVDGLLPHESPLDFHATLPELDAGRVLCAGHNPNLNELLAAATGQPSPFTWIKKAGCACVEIDGGRGTLKWLYEPKTLRRLGGAA